jgi:UDP-sugar transporter A1/2/3
MLVTLCAQTTLCVLLVKASRAVPVGERCIPSAAIVMTEVLKLMVSAVCLVATEGVSVVSSYLADAKNRRNSLALLPPALIYTVQNNLTYFALTCISASDLQLLSQGKILTTAFFSVLFLGTRLSRIQWIALALLVVGVILAESEPLRASGACLRFCCFFFFFCFLSFSRPL